VMYDIARRISQGSSRRLLPASALHAWRGVLLGLALCAGLLSSAFAAVRFDVFVGYDGVVPEASWFPVVGEIDNQGPSFNAVVEFTAGYQTQARLMAVELPSGTVKRFVMPVFSTGRYQYHWTARLLDEHAKVRAEQQGRQDEVDWGIPLAGAM